MSYEDYSGWSLHMDDNSMHQMMFQTVDFPSVREYPITGYVLTLSSDPPKNSRVEVLSTGNGVTLHAENLFLLHLPREKHSDLFRYWRRTHVR